MSQFMDRALGDMVKATKPLRRRGSKMEKVGGGVVKNKRGGAAGTSANPSTNLKPVFKAPAPVKSTAVKILLENLHPRVNDADIKELFGSIGPIKKSSIFCNAQGKPMGTAEVIYHKPEHVTKAIQAYNNVSLDGRPMKLSVVEPPKSDVLSRLAAPKRPLKTQLPLQGNKKPLRGIMKGRSGRVAKGPKVRRVQKTEADLNNELMTYQQN